MNAVPRFYAMKLCDKKFLQSHLSNSICVSGLNFGTSFDSGLLKKSHESLARKLFIAKRLQDITPSRRNFSARDGVRPLVAASDSLKLFVSDNLMIAY